MHLQIVRYFVIVALAILAASCTSGPRPVGVCPDGTPMIAQDCAKAYPAFGRKLIAAVSADLEKAGKKLATVDAALATDVVKLRADYDQLNNAMQLANTGLCVAQNGNLCDAQIRSKIVAAQGIATSHMTNARLLSRRFDQISEQLASAPADQKASLITELRQGIAAFRNEVETSTKTIGDALK